MHSPVRSSAVRSALPQPEKRTLVPGLAAYFVATEGVAARLGPADSSGVLRELREGYRAD